MNTSRTLGTLGTADSTSTHSGLPGLRGTEHIGFTVPDLDEATDFFVNVIGCRQMFELGPFAAEDDWMNTHLNVHPRAVMRRLRFFRCQYGSNFEIFEYESPDQNRVPPGTAMWADRILPFMSTISSLPSST